MAVTHQSLREKVHSVKQGDTLGKIATENRTLLEASGMWNKGESLLDAVNRLAEYNGIKDINVVRIGQKINIPNKRTSEQESAPLKPSLPTPSTPEPLDPLHDVVQSLIHGPLANNTSSINSMEFPPPPLRADGDLAPQFSSARKEWLEQQLGTQYGNNPKLGTWDCMSLPMELMEQTGMSVKLPKDPRLDQLMNRYLDDVAEVQLRSDGGFKAISKSKDPSAYVGSLEDARIGDFVGIGHRYNKGEGNPPRSIMHGGNITGLIRENGKVVDLEIVHASSEHGEVVKTTLSAYLKHMQPNDQYTTAFIGRLSGETVVANGGNVNQDTRVA